jgi:hypothetical protein
MTPFEFVFALISIITSLALTQLITGGVAIVRHRERGGLSIAHALWMWIAFAVVIGNWGALWGVRVDPDWPPLRVLGWLTSMTSLYAFCALVVPEVERGTQLNLKDFHEREGRLYIIAHNVFSALAICLVLLISGLSLDRMHLLLPPIGALALGMIALFTRGRLQLVVSILLAILATSFMLRNITIIAA